MERCQEDHGQGWNRGGVDQAVAGGAQALRDHARRGSTGSALRWTASGRYGRSSDQGERDPPTGWRVRSRRCARHPSPTPLPRGPRLRSASPLAERRRSTPLSRDEANFDVATAPSYTAPNGSGNKASRNFIPEHAHTPETGGTPILSADEADVIDLVAQSVRCHIIGRCSNWIPKVAPGAAYWSTFELLEKTIRHDGGSAGTAFAGHRRKRVRRSPCR